MAYTVCQSSPTRIHIVYRHWRHAQCTNLRSENWNAFDANCELVVNLIDVDYNKDPNTNNVGLECANGRGKRSSPRTSETKRSTQCSLH